MDWPVFAHEAMATTFRIAIAGQSARYAGEAAAAAFRELDRLESELSRYVETSDIARANRLPRNQSVRIGDDALACLLLGANLSAATGGAFDVAFASSAAPGDTDGIRFALDPATHLLTSLADRLRLDLGAIGKGYALDRMADILRDWEAEAACLDAGGSTVLALGAPPGAAGWPIGIADSVRPAAHRAASASGVAVLGPHLIDPRTARAAKRTTRVWSFAPEAAAADALSTAFFVWKDAEVAAFCAGHPEYGAVLTRRKGAAVWHGATV